MLQSPHAPDALASRLVCCPDLAMLAPSLFLMVLGDNMLSLAPLVFWLLPISPQLSYLVSLIATTQPFTRCKHLTYIGTHTTMHPYLASDLAHCAARHSSDYHALPLLKASTINPIDTDYPDIAVLYCWKIKWQCQSFYDHQHPKMVDDELLPMI